MQITTSPFWQRWNALFTVAPMAVLFDRFFWQQGLGLNLSLFALVAMAVAMARQGWSKCSVPARWACAGTALAAGMVYVHHSTVALAGTFGGLLLFAGLVHEPALRSVFHGTAQAFAATVLAPFKLRSGIAVLRGTDSTPGVAWRWSRTAVLPIAITLVFIMLYRGGNPRFDAITASFFDGMFELLGELFTPRVLFFGLGLLVSAVLVRRLAPGLLAHNEHALGDALMRTRVRRPKWARPLGLDPLERERRGGVVLLVLVNTVLLVVNVIDINWVWYGFTVPEGFSLKQFVHEGTWLLIMSILLSIVVLLYLFRGNLNFHPRNNGLKLLAKVWIAQNFVLGISVFLRNWHYISFHGLAYKRIGVIVFLALVLIGLLTLFRKVHGRRSFYYLARVNGWACFAMLAGLTLVDWDSTIVRYNLQHVNPGEIDIDNYLAMSDKVLPLLYADLDKVELQMARHRANRVRWVEHLDPAEFRQQLDGRRNRFVHRMARQTWQESNLADRRTMAALKGFAQSTAP
ncbi:MAG: DUF4173 domain-containing protein [Flavobacteriales bacterium]|nr:DUF4173 domain-containing protein [Flavobacteriales bacterium]